MFNSKLVRLGVCIAFAMGSNAAVAESLAPLNALEIVGLSGNAVSLFQAPQSGNNLKVTISGNGNGAPVNGYVADVAWFGELAPGRISQKGTYQNINLDVSGSSNLFAISQTGSSNSALGQISGTSNTALVRQSGTGNRTQFVQFGTGNTLSVLQNM